MDRVMAQAQKSDWKTKPLPRKRETIELGLRFSSGEMERIWQGFVPSMMEEKWFIYFADNVLYCHRSWTGYCIYKVYSRAEDAGFSLTHMDVNRNPEQYSETDKVNDRYELISLLNTYLF